MNDLRTACDRCGKVTRPDDVHTCSPKGLPHCENSCEANAFKIEIRRLKAEKKELLEALKEAADAIESWGAYANDYFAAKHDLQSDINSARAAIAKAEAA